MAQLERLKLQLQINDTGEDTLLNDFLESAKFAILSRRYPYTDFPVNEAGETVLENRYSDLQVRIAVYLYNKMGAEGQTGHSENGIGRSYESADIPESLLQQVTPLIGTPVSLGEET